MIFKQGLHFTEILVIKIFLNWWSQIHLTIINEVISNFKEIFWIQLVYVFGTGELNSFTSKGEFLKQIAEIISSKAEERSNFTLIRPGIRGRSRVFFFQFFQQIEITDDTESTVRRNRLVKLKMIPVQMRYEHHTLLWSILPNTTIVQFNQSWINLRTFIAFVPKIA